MPPRQKTRIVKASASPFYSSSWLTNPNAFFWVVAHFESINAHISRPLQGMDPTLKQLITSAVTSAVISALVTLYVKNDNDIQSLCEMFQKTFSSRESSPLLDAQTPNNLAINPADPGASPKPSLLPESGSKNER